MRLRTTKTGRKANLARRVVATLGLAAVASMGAVAVTAAPAQALPSNCSKLVRSQSNAVVCKSGTGYYRAWARCTNETNNRKTYRYGSWRSVGSIASNASCRAHEYILKSTDAGIGRSNYLPPS